LEKFDSEVISDLINTFYPQAIEEQKLSPIISPKIELERYDPDKDFTFTAQTAIKPPVTVGDYRKALKELYAKKQTAQDSLPEAKDSKEHQHVHLSPNDLVEAILSVTQIEIPELVVEEEVNRMLSRLVQQLQPLNLDMNAYLKSINKTGEQLREEYAQVAQKNIAGEMALLDLVNQAKTEVAESEIDATINAIGDEKLKERYQQNPLEKAYIKSIIAKNKFIWQAISEAEGEDHSHEQEEHAK
ncbi:MAG: trigger factor, partial [bacterium]